MSLIEPIKTKLVEGGTGEVIPVELLNGTVAYHNSALDHLKAHHTADFRGIYSHKGLNFASASACFDFGPDGPNVHMRPPFGGLLWAEGFKEAPRMTMEPVVSPSSYGPKPGWFLHWEMESKEPMTVTIGVALANDVTSGHDGVWHLDFVDGKADLNILYYSKEYVDKETKEPALSNDFMRAMRRIYLMVRQ